jgi:hypothetical protein
MLLEDKISIHKSLTHVLNTHNLDHYQNLKLQYDVLLFFCFVNKSTKYYFINPIGTCGVHTCLS